MKGCPALSCHVSSSPVVSQHVLLLSQQAVSRYPECGFATEGQFQMSSATFDVSPSACRDVLTGVGSGVCPWSRSSDLEALNRDAKVTISVLTTSFHDMLYRKASSFIEQLVPNTFLSRFSNSFSRSCLRETSTGQSNRSATNVSENGNNSFMIPSQFVTCPPSNPKVWICDPSRRPTGCSRIT